MKKISLLVLLVAALNLKGASNSNSEESLSGALTSLAIIEQFKAGLGVTPAMINTVNHFLHDPKDQDKRWEEPLATLTEETSGNVSTKKCYTKKDVCKEMERFETLGGAGQLLLLGTIQKVYDTIQKLR